MKNLLLLGASALLLASCSSEVARLNFSGLSTQGNILADSTVVHLTPDEELGLWCDFDVTYSGSGKMFYVIEAYAQDTLMGVYSLDPMHTNPTTGEVYLTLGNTTEISRSGKMNFFYVGEEDDYLLKAYVMGDGLEMKEIEELALVLKK